MQREGSSQRRPQEESMTIVTPASTIREVIRAANAGDVDGMMAHFADDIVLSLNPRLPAMAAAFQGCQGLHEYLQRIVGSGFHVEAGEFETSGDEVRWRSRVSGGLFARAGVDRAEASSRAVVQGGLIRSLDIHYSPQTVSQLEAALLEHA